MRGLPEIGITDGDESLHVATPNSAVCRIGAPALEAKSGKAGRAERQPEVVGIC